MTHLAAAFNRVRGHPLSRNTAWILGGQMLGFLLQAAFFILLARFLGVREYGKFAGAFALVNILMPYSPLGSGMVFMRYVTADPLTASVYWGNCLGLIVLMSTTIAFALYVLGTKLKVTHDLRLVMILVVANCICAQVVLCSSTVFQTLDKFRTTAILRTLPYLMRLGALLAMRPFIPHATALQWALGVLASSAVSAAIACLWVRRTIGPLRFDARLIAAHLREGAGYSFAGSTQSAYNDIDKAMLSRFGMDAENGIYTLAYRVVDIAGAPAQALDGASLPRYFAASRRGGTLRLARKLVPAAALTGLIAGIGCLLASSVLPHLVGRDFAGVVSALRWLAPLPMLRSIHQLAGSAITGAGFQRYRTAAQLAVACLNAAANLWLIPKYGWHGAAWTSLASDGAMGVINVALLLWLRTREAISGLPLSLVESDSGMKVSV